MPFLETISFSTHSPQSFLICKGHFLAHEGSLPSHSEINKEIDQFVENFIVFIHKIILEDQIRYTGIFRILSTFVSSLQLLR